MVMDRNEPVARISAASHSALHDLDDDAYLDELERRGIITKAKKKLPRDWFKKNPPVKLAPGTSLVRELLKEREESPF